MKIFNKELEKHLLFDELSVVSYGALCFIFNLIGMIVVATIVVLLLIQLINYYPSYAKFLIAIMFLLSGLLSNWLINKICSYFDKKSGCYIPPSNPTLNKLKNATKQNDCVNLVKLWKCFNPNNPNNSIVLTKEQKDIELLQKLDDDLVRFIENADDVTIKLFNLDDFESYQQLYMKYIAPKQKEEVLNKIQTLIEHHGSNQESHLIKQLRLLKNEVEEYDTKTADYFEFKKWHEDVLDMLKLDKDNDMVKNNYQHIIQEINNNKKD
jgi:hypothetical protein